jgi:hypothetical protein
MSQYQAYAEKPTEFLALTGYTRQEFEALGPPFQDSDDQWMRTHRLDGKARGKRKHRNYHTCPLPRIEDKLFFSLNYLKTNHLQTVQGALFGISQPKANVWIHCLHPILNQSLASLGERPARQREAVPFDETAAALYFHDGPERPIQRPRDPEPQRLYYRGKKNNPRSKIMA